MRPIGTMIEMRAQTSGLASASRIAPSAGTGGWKPRLAVRFPPSAGVPGTPARCSAQAIAVPVRIATSPPGSPPGSLTCPM